MNCYLCLLPIASLDKVLKWLSFFSGWSFFDLGDKKSGCLLRLTGGRLIQ